MINPWHTPNPLPRSAWSDEHLEQHQSELLLERSALIEINDPYTRLPRIEASLARTENEMLKRLMSKL